MNQSSHPPARLLKHSLTRSLDESLNESVNLLFSNLLTLTQSLAYSLSESITYLLTHSLTHLLNQITHVFSYFLTYAITRLLTHSINQSIIQHPLTRSLAHLPIDKAILGSLAVNHSKWTLFTGGTLFNVWQCKCKLLTDFICSQVFILPVIGLCSVRSHVFSVVCYFCLGSAARRRDMKISFLVYMYCIYKKYL